MIPLLRTPLGRCRLGVGRVDITPPPDAYHRSWGAALHDRAEGIHRPLTATALALAPQSGDDMLCALFALDLGWMRADEMAALLARLREGTGLPPDRVVVTFSHTHAGANLDLARAGEPGGEHIAPYLAALPERLLEAFAVARNRVAPVDLTYGRGRCALALHRDARDEERDLFVCGPNPGGPSDDTVLVVRATGADGRPVADLVNYACHPTTLAWDNRLISPDYAGALRETVERHTGVPCVFLQGAAGDLGPVRGFVGDPGVADSNGRQLGFAALSAFEALPPPGRQWAYAGPVLSGATIGAWDWAGVDARRQAQTGAFAVRTETLSLPYRPQPAAAELEADLAAWSRRLQAAQAAGDAAARREARARVERLRRALDRAAATGGAAAAEYVVLLWRLGEGVLVMVGGEPYQQLQVNLRRRFPDTAVLVVELCNQAHSYLLARDAYGVGHYQDEVAVLAPGCLEAVEAAAARVLIAWGLS